MKLGFPEIIIVVISLLLLGMLLRLVIKALGKLTNKSHYLVVGIGMLVIAIGYYLWASQHPEMQFPWGRKATYILYGVYIWFMLKFLIDMPFLHGKKDGGSLLQIVIYFCMAMIWLALAITEELNWLTVARGLIVAGNCDLGISNLRGWIKKRNTDTVKA